MKKLGFCLFFIFSIVFIGCTDKEKNNTENKSEGSAVKNQSIAFVEKKEYSHQSGLEGNIIREKKIISREKKTLTINPAFEANVTSDKIILLTNNGEPQPYRFIGTDIKAMQMPDGKMHQVESKDERIWMNIPEYGEMQVIKLNGKVYLFDDDDQAYEVKVKSGELIAEATDLTDKLLAMNN